MLEQLTIRVVDGHHGDRGGRVLKNRIFLGERLSANIGWMQLRVNLWRSYALTKTWRMVRSNYIYDSQQLVVPAYLKKNCSFDPIN